MPQKTRVPAVEGWFTMDDGQPSLIGSRCTDSGSYFFPKEMEHSRVPGFGDSKLEEVNLSRTGTLWSWTDAAYAPPPPFVAQDPHVPFAIAAVELAEEQMVIMGQVATGISVDDLSMGMEMELVLETLYEDDDNEYIVWKWKPTGSVASTGDDS